MLALITSWDSLQSFSRPLLVKGCTVLLSLSAIMWDVCTELQPTTKTTAASSIMTSIFAWVVPFTLLNSVTASYRGCKKESPAPILGRKKKEFCLGQSVSNSSKQTALAKQCIQLLKGFLKTLPGRTLYSLQEGCHCGMMRE